MPMDDVELDRIGQYYFSSLGLLVDGMGKQPGPGRECPRLMISSPSPPQDGYKQSQKERRG